jgi:hypothetical protein
MSGWAKGTRCDVHVDADFLRFWIGDARQPVPTPTGSIPLAAKIDCGSGDPNIGGRRQVQPRAHSRAVTAAIVGNAQFATASKPS